MLKSMFVLCVALTLGACSSQQKVATGKPPIKTIAIIPATDPVTYSFENVSAVQFLIPLAATVNYVDSQSKAGTFNEKLRARPVALGRKLTDDVSSALRALGYEVQILEGVVRPADDPDGVDYAQIPTTADALLHLRFTDVGLYSPRSSINYLPRVNAYAAVIVKGLRNYLYDQEIHYGVDARSGNDWAIAADPKFAYPSFDAVLGNLDSVREAFVTGAGEVSKRMSGQIHDAIK